MRGVVHENVNFQMLTFRVFLVRFCEKYCGVSEGGEKRN